MKANTYSNWQPISDIDCWVIIDKIEDSDEGLAIFINVNKSGKKFKIVFDPYVAYRNMDESYRTRTFSQHGAFESSFHQVANSTWLKWLHEESQGYYKGNSINHYAIITEADCIDILSEFEPYIVPIDHGKIANII